MSRALHTAVLAAALPAGLGAGLAQAQDSVFCPDPAAPVLSLSYQSRYQDNDASRSVLDKEAEARAEAALRPVDDLLRDLSRRNDARGSATDDDTRLAEATCMLRQMAIWAQADALADQRTQTAQLGIGSRLASFALMARMAGADTGRTADLAQVTDWLQRRIHEQMVFWETAPNGSARGNLRAWAALAGAAVADLSDDVVIRGWAAWSVHYVLCSANPDGSLPQEMIRGRLALHYQMHALAPLVTSVALLEAQGVALRDRCDGALQRAARFALLDLADGQRSQARTGEVQSFFDGSTELRNFHIAWIEPYLALFPDPLADTLAAPRRPLKYSKLGGDQTQIWQR